MSLLKLPVAGSTFKTELSTAAVPLTGSGTPTPDANNSLTLTTTAAHGLTVGMGVIVTGSSNSAYDNVVLQVLSVPSTTTLVVASSLGQVTGTWTLVPVIFPAAGTYCCVTGANATIMYSPDNKGYAQSAYNGTLSGGTLRTLIAASSQGYFWTDGFGVMIVCSGSAGTTYYSQVN